MQEQAELDARLDGVKFGSAWEASWLCDNVRKGWAERINELVMSICALKRKGSR
jgi:hypothetical protein